MKYYIMTKLATFDENRDPDDESYAEKLVEEQDKILEELGYNITDTAYLMKMENKYCIHTIYDAIQCLALKDGADLVSFENGNIGYIGYYNGFSLEYNHFEIICKADNESLLEKYGNEFNYQDSKELFEDRFYSFEWDESFYMDDLIDYLNEKGE